MYLMFAILCTLLAWLNWMLWGLYGETKDLVVGCICGGIAVIMTILYAQDQT